MSINRFDNIHIFADNTNNQRTRCDRFWYVMSYAITKEEATKTDWVHNGHAICIDCAKAIPIDYPDITMPAPYGFYNKPYR